MSERNLKNDNHNIINTEKLKSKIDFFERKNNILQDKLKIKQDILIIIMVHNTIMSK